MWAARKSDIHSECLGRKSSAKISSTGAVLAIHIRTLWLETPYNAISAALARTWSKYLGFVMVSWISCSDFIWWRWAMVSSSMTRSRSPGCKAGCAMISEERHVAARARTELMSGGQLKARFGMPTRTAKESSPSNVRVRLVCRR